MNCKTLNLSKQNKNKKFGLLKLEDKKLETEGYFKNFKDKRQVGKTHLPNKTILF